MGFGSRFDLTEEPIAGLLATKKGGNDPKDIARSPRSTTGAPNGQSRFKVKEPDAIMGAFNLS